VPADSKGPTKSPPTVSVCGIGASAGGIEALSQFFEMLPTDLGLAYAVVVHLSPDHESELPMILGRRTKMPVVQVCDHEEAELLPDHVYVIAPDRKLLITGSSVRATPFEQPRGHRMAIDLLFRSLAESRGDGFAVVFSGTGSDGAAGAKEVKGHGGLVLVQDPEEAAYGEMPRAVIATGVADVVLPLQQLAARLAELSRNKPHFLPLQTEKEPQPITEVEEKALRDIFDLLRKTTGHDFSKYKRGTVLRRLSRRMQLTGQLSIAEYAQYLRAHSPEVDALFGDFLISVTSFFRDPESWAALQAQAIGPLLEQIEPDEQLRVWVPGCSSGEEAYTVAMLFQEEAHRRNIPINHLLVFATDVDERTLATAREGLFPQSITADLSQTRLERFFRRENEHYRVVNEVRDRIVFAAHDLLRDPPFSRLHLITCRNLLIYLDRELQDQVMGTFRYALREHGYLLLGASEVVDEDLFEPLDARHRIFLARSRAGARVQLPELLSAPGPRSVRYGHEAPPPSKSTALELHLAALEQTAPPSVLIDDRGNVSHLSPSAARFFQQSGGPPARRLTDLVRPELRDELHALINRAREHPDPHLSPFLSVTFNGSTHQVAVLVQQRPPMKDAREQILVTFLDGGVIASEAASLAQEPSTELVRELRGKLRQADQRIESMREEHFSINEDLRAANEELQSLNEEYRSTTEELETSKEELQSVNEELQTVNNELKLKLEEVSRAHSDLENLMAATNVATLFLDRELRIKRFTPSLGEIFSVKVRDIERPIGDITHSLDYANLEQDARRVLTDPAPIERETHSRDGRTFIAHLTPYRLAGARDVDGVVITFHDVSALKAAEFALREREARLASETMANLHRMTTAAATAANSQEALDHILAAAMELQNADFGNLQLLDAGAKELRIVAQRGFGSQFLEHFRSVGSDDASSFGRALRSREAVQIADVTLDAAFAPYREIAGQAGYRAVQSTPLITRTGVMVGVLSVHFREPHVFSEQDRRLGDLIGRQAADLIESRVHQDRLAHADTILTQQSAELASAQKVSAATGGGPRE
jgi:two-component system, chemotaxis family, CheB/CheR fusion protein